MLTLTLLTVNLDRMGGGNCNIEFSLKIIIIIVIFCMSQKFLTILTGWIGLLSVLQISSELPFKEKEQARSLTL